MTAFLIRGDARRVPLATGSVQVVVTSPPYFGLRSYGGQTSVWGGDPDCPHTLEDGPALKPMTGGTGAASKKQVTNAGSQFGNAWAEQVPPIVGRNDGGRNIGGRGGNYQDDGPRRVHGVTSATCTHRDAGVRPCIVLDPFSGSGTTAFVAAQLGRTGVGVELSEDYCKQARYGRLSQDFLPFGPPARPTDVESLA